MKKETTRVHVASTQLQSQTQEELEVGHLTHLDDSLFSISRNKPRLTRAQKRRARQQHALKTAANAPSIRCGLDISREKMKKLQHSDSTLEGAWKVARGEPGPVGKGFFEKDDLLYLHYVPPGSSDEDDEVEQLVLPVGCREAALRLAHSIPLAGHLGRN